MNRHIVSVSYALLALGGACGESVSVSTTQLTSAITDPCNGVSAPLSPVGAAVHGVVGSKLSPCVAFPEHWLYNIDNIDDQLDDVFAAARRELELTESTFSHASLFDGTDAYRFPEALMQLHRKVAARVGTPVPDEAKPIVRFYFGDPDMDLQHAYDSLARALAVAADDGAPASWNVKLAVAKSSTYLNGWNHSKLTIRDRIEAIASSIETLEHEMAVQLAGEPADEAQAWFDVIWTQASTTCLAPIGSTLCGRIPRAPLITGSTPHRFRPANVLSLERGELDTEFNTEADDALLAGMDAATHSIFFLNPGLVGDLVYPRLLPVIDYTHIFSPVLVTKIAERVAAGVDVKFVWGTQANPLTASNWLNIESMLEQRLDTLGLGAVQKDIAHCMFHVARYTDGRQSPNPDQTVPAASHAKFYMLDRSFYVGSQNLYPSGFKGAYDSPGLKEFGFLVDSQAGVNDDLAAEVVTRVVEPIWARSSLAPQVSNYAVCGALSHPVRLVGTATLASGTVSCSSNFDLQLDFSQVQHDEIATVLGTAECSNAGHSANVFMRGVIQAGGHFDGTISGFVPGITSAETALTGNLSHGTLSLAFSGREPFLGVPYQGTVTTHVAACEGLPADTCTDACAWYWCAAGGAGACFARGTPNSEACPPSDPATCAAIGVPDSCTNGCAWYWCAADGAGACFPRGTPNSEACSVGG